MANDRNTIDSDTANFTVLKIIEQANLFNNRYLMVSVSHKDAFVSLVMSITPNPSLPSTTQQHVSILMLCVLDVLEVTKWGKEESCKGGTLWGAAAQKQ
jgi:hypothetical protein